MQQYWAVKADPQYAGHLLLFQLGGFLEAFFEDAELLADTLGIVLTTRGLHLGRPVPMAGIPLATRDGHIARLVRAGVKVVICEQLDGISSAATRAAAELQAGTAAATGGAPPASPVPSAPQASAPASAPPPSTLMRRAVTRVVTQGTVVDDALLQPRSHNFLAAVAFGAGARAGIAWLDLSTGDFMVGGAPVSSLGTELAAFPPAELLLPLRGGASARPGPATSASASGTLTLEAAVRDAGGEVDRATAAMVAAARAGAGAPVDLFGGDVGGTTLTFLDAAQWSSGAASDAATTALDHALGWVSPSAAPTAAGGASSSSATAYRPAIPVTQLQYAAAAALLRYVAWTQLGRLPRIRPPTVLDIAAGAPAPTTDDGAVASLSPATVPSQPLPAQNTHAEVGVRLPSGGLPRLVVDAGTRRSLELTRPTFGRRRARGSLLHAIDACETAAGSRLLDARLCAPLADAEAIAHRQDGVASLLRDEALRSSVRSALSHVPDLERCLARLAVARGTVSDLLQLRAGLAAARAVGQLLVTGDYVRHHVPHRRTTAATVSGASRYATAAAAVGRGGGAEDDALLHTALAAAAAAGVPHLCPVAASAQDFDFVGVPSPGAPPASLPVGLAAAAAACLLPTHTAAPIPPALTAGATDDGAAVRELAAVGQLLADALVAPARPAGESSDGGESTASPPPVDGSWIRAGFDTALDSARAARDGGAAAAAALAASLTGATGVAGLRVRRLDDVGYVVEVPIASAHTLDTYGRGGGGGSGSGDGGGGGGLPLMQLSTIGADGSVATRSSTAARPPPSPLHFSRVRTLKATVRYTCAPTARLDADIASAAARVEALEARIVARLCAAAVRASDAIAAVARATAVIDVAAAAAHVAANCTLVRPVVTAPGVTAPADAPSSWAPGVDVARVGHNELVLVGGRHLVVERALAEGWAGASRDDAAEVLAPSRGVGGSVGAGGGEDENDDFAPRVLPAAPAPARAFIPNDTLLGCLPPAGTAAPQRRGADAHVALLVGPNMGGKSTYLRQVAHAVVLAQMGWYVPAAGARLGVVDRLFSRVGASDDVTRDRSTFWLEMEESAAILRHASPRSLVVVDEVGRGTAAVDGLALAGAILEHLAHVTRCRTLFATHIHELVAIALAPRAPPAGGSGGTTGAATVACYSMAAATPAGDDVVTGGESGGAAPPVLLSHRVVPHAVYAALDAAGGVATPALWRACASHSHGVAVAERAGVPPAVVRRARDILRHLDASAAAGAWAAAVASLPPLA